MKMYYEFDQPLQGSDAILYLSFVCVCIFFFNVFAHIEELREYVLSSRLSLDMPCYNDPLFNWIMCRCEL